MSEIPEHVDVILVGTSLTNSILAAACSRIGKTVLHLDKNSYYGGDWASFTYQQLIDWIKINYPNDPSLESINEELINSSRMFCIDLAPRFLYSNGPMVELLVKSNVARYHEFKNNIRILNLIGDDIHVMPCRRNEVFTSPLLSNLADKRRLMKFIELCIKYNIGEDSVGDQAAPADCEIKSNSQKPIFRFLEEKGINETLREFIINSIAMVQPTDSTELACQKIKKFMMATERYGRSPFLFPLYGCGEFPQSFCRLSAVFGGIYCLNRKVENLELVENPDTAKQDLRNRFKVKFSGDDDITVSSDILVTDYNYATEFEKYIPIPKLLSGKLSRAIIISNKSIVKSDSSDSVSFLKIPPGKTNQNPIFVLEFNSSTLVCPKEFNIVYLWTRSSAETPRADLRSTVERVFGENTDSILWEFYYQQLAEQNLSDHDRRIPGLYVTSPPCDDIDYQSNIKEAETLFNSMYSDQDFLPRAPDPDELISS